MKILDLFLRMLAFIVSNKFIRRYRSLKHRINSYAVKGNLKSAGSNFFMQYPSYVKGGSFITIGDDFLANERLRLEAYDDYLGNKYSPKITIGNGVAINYDCHIGCINNIYIGNNVLIASRVFITDHSHGNATSKYIDVPPGLRKLESKGGVIINDNVWIGEGVVILANVTIGKNAIIGANAVVTKNVPAQAVVVGNPARIIKYITDER